MKQQFDINRVIERYGLNEEDVADVLFPHVRYKLMALNRIKKGEAFIDTNQLAALADLIGIFIYDLFEYDGWSTNTKDNCVTFSKGTFVAKLNYDNTFLTVYDGNVVISKMVTCKNMTLDQFYNLLNNIINNYQDGNN